MALKGVQALATQAGLTEGRDSSSAGERAQGIIERLRMRKAAAIQNFGDAMGRADLSPSAPATPHALAETVTEQGTPVLSRQAMDAALSVMKPVAELLQEPPAAKEPSRFAVAQADKPVLGVSPNAKDAAELAHG